MSDVPWPAIAVAVVAAVAGFMWPRQPRPPRHEHTWRLAALHPTALYGPRDTLPVSWETTVLYQCPSCTRLYTETLTGSWSLDANGELRRAPAR